MRCQKVLLRIVARIVLVEGTRIKEANMNSEESDLNAYIVAYDVDTKIDKPKTPDQVYSAIKEVLQSYHTNGQLTESCWLVLTSKEVDKIRDALKQAARECDRILVVKSARVAAWHKLLSPTQWVKENI